MSYLRLSPSVRFGPSGCCSNKILLFGGNHFFSHEVCSECLQPTIPSRKYSVRPARSSGVSHSAREYAIRAKFSSISSFRLLRDSTIIRLFSSAVWQYFSFVRSLIADSWPIGRTRTAWPTTALAHGYAWGIVDAPGSDPSLTLFSCPCNPTSSAGVSCPFSQF